MSQKPKKEKSKLRKTLEWVFTGLFLALIAGVAGLRIYQNATQNYSIFGTQYPVVLTDSMETDYMVGDVLIVQNINGDDDIREKIHVDSDISFYWNIVNPQTRQSQKVMMTHRVQTVSEDPTYKDGYRWTFVTHGINKQSEQCGGGDCTNQTQTFHEDSLIGVVTGKSPFLSFLNTVTKSVWTLIVLILIPSLYLVVTSVINLVKGLDAIEEEAKANVTSTEYKDDLLKGMSKEDRDRLKQELLDEMIEKANKKNGK